MWNMFRVPIPGYPSREDFSPVYIFVGKKLSHPLRTGLVTNELEGTIEEEPPFYSI